MEVDENSRPLSQPDLSATEAVSSAPDLTVGNLLFYFFPGRDHYLAAVQGLEPKTLDAIYAWCARWRAYEAPAPRIDVFCVAQRAHLRELPQHILIECDSVMSEGVWLRDYNAIVIGPGRAPVEWRLVHELGHAYLDIVASPYRFPAALSEAFAHAVEETFTRTVDEPAESGRWQRLPPEYRLSARQVCNCHFEVSAGDYRSYWAFSWSCYWLLAFCVWRNPRRLPGLLSGAMERNIREPSELFRWLCTYAGLTEDEFEDEFRALILGEGDTRADESGLPPD
jgi:hypothetical protein